MKQSNGFVPESMVPEPMASESTTIDESVPHENHAEINASAVGGSNEAPEVFSLAPIKPKGLPKFKLTALYKSRLKWCCVIHILLFLVMCARLSEDVLDRFEIFWLVLEELFIPKPLFFEYLYASSVIFAFIGLRALSKNLGSLKTYAAGIIIFSICPLIFGAAYYFHDILEYADKKQEAEIEKWQGFPVACYTYIFVFVAVQVHLYSIYFCAKLLKIWSSKMKKN